MDRLHDWIAGTVPPFPSSSSLPVAPLVKLSYRKLVNRDEVELTRLFSACKTMGIFLLDLSDQPEILRAVDDMFKLSRKVFSLPSRVNLTNNMENNRPHLAGYKARGSTEVDEEGSRDNAEMYNILCRDIFNKRPSGVTYNAPILKALPDCLSGFATESVMVSTAILKILIEEVVGTDETRNSNTYFPECIGSCSSSSHVRLCKYSRQKRIMKQKHDDSLLAVEGGTLNLQGHTDCGFLTLLFTMVGGLQIYLVKQSGYEDGWYWVPPIPGHAVVNLGDAMSAFSAGTFKSVLHRVVTPPGPQRDITKYSVAYFFKPESGM